MEREHGGENPDSEYEPDFVLPHRDAVREDNWADFEAQGFQVVRNDVPDDEFDFEFDNARHFYGADNVYSGDPFDDAAGRPLRHKPGRGIYTSPQGFDYMRRLVDEHGPR